MAEAEHGGGRGKVPANFFSGVIQPLPLAMPAAADAVGINSLADTTEHAWPPTPATSRERDRERDREGDSESARASVYQQVFRGGDTCEENPRKWKVAGAAQQSNSATARQHAKCNSVASVSAAIPVITESLTCVP